MLFRSVVFAGLSEAQPVHERLRFLVRHVVVIVGAGVLPTNLPDPHPYRTFRRAAVDRVPDEKVPQGVLRETRQTGLLHRGLEAVVKVLRVEVVTTGGILAAPFGGEE